jgi:hypothetical protein
MGRRTPVLAYQFGLPELRRRSGLDSRGLETVTDATVRTSISELKSSSEASQGDRMAALRQNLPVLELALWTPRPSARLTALQYSIGEPRWITDLDQGKQNSLPRSAPQCERSENNSARLR